MSADQEWFEGRSTDDELNERWYWRRVGFAIFCGIVLALITLPLYAEPLALVVSGDGVRITLHSEPCALKEVVNLKKRATWEEKGKVSEGCWGVQGGAVMFYFDDRTVVLVPAQAFQKVTGA